MKASELRIGNFIYWNHKGVPFNEYMWSHIVKSISEDEVWVTAGYTSIGKIQPIPLTEELLLKFGFERHPEKSNKVFFKLAGKCLMECNLTYDIVDLVKRVSFDLDIEIKYVHQLQNLYFALTNEELTYEQQK